MSAESGHFWWNWWTKLAPWTVWYWGQGGGRNTNVTWIRWITGDKGGMWKECKHCEDLRWVVRRRWHQDGSRNDCVREPSAYQGMNTWDLGKLLDCIYLSPKLVFGGQQIALLLQKLVRFYFHSWTYIGQWKLQYMPSPGTGYWHEGGIEKRRRLSCISYNDSTTAVTKKQRRVHNLH